MTLRNLLRNDSHFLVKYLCDDKLQVRSRIHVKDADEVLISHLYEVQWGRPNQVSTAKIIASGTDNQMRIKLKEITTTLSAHSPSPPSSPPSSPSPLPSPRSPTPPPPRVTNTRTALPKKPLATVINRSGPPDEVTLTTLEPAVGLIRVNQETPVRSPPATTTSRRLLFADADGALPMLDKILCGIETLTQRVTKIESKINSLQSQQDKLMELMSRNSNEMYSEVQITPEIALQSVTQELEIPAEKLQILRRAANSAGNFGKILTQHYFPELFGPGNLRGMYSWNGGGKYDKKELDPRRKQAIKNYVGMFYPEAKRDAGFRCHVIPNINEGLRRPTKKRKNTQDDSDTEDN